MTRTHSVRHAATTTKDSVRHAAEVMAPYAGSARVTATRYAGRYAHEARRMLAPTVTAAAGQARRVAIRQYDAHLAPRLAQARDAVPPGVMSTTASAAQHTRRTARRAAKYAAPRMERAMGSARAATEPVREEAVGRAGAALAALRGQVSPADVAKLVRRNQRRARAGQTTKRFMVLGVLAGAGIAAWRWWNRQANPEWLIEAPSATEPTEDERMTPGNVASPNRTTLEDDEPASPRHRGQHGGDSNG